MPQRTVTLGIRLTRTEREQLARAAASEGFEEVSSFARAVLFNRTPAIRRCHITQLNHGSGILTAARQMAQLLEKWRSFNARPNAANDNLGSPSHNDDLYDLLNAFLQLESALDETRRKLELRYLGARRSTLLRR